MYSCKAHDIDSGRTRVAGRREHDDIPLPHMVTKSKVGFIPALVNTTMTNHTIILLKSVCLSAFANCRSQFLLDRLGRCL